MKKKTSKKRHSEDWYAIKRKVDDPQKFHEFYVSERNAKYVVVNHLSGLAVEIVKVRITEL